MYNSLPHHYQDLVPLLSLEDYQSKCHKQLCERHASGVGGLPEMSENSRGDRALAERGLDTLKCFGHWAEDISSDGAPTPTGFVVENDPTGSIVIIFN